MTITLTPEQEQVIEGAIRAGVVQSVDDFIAAAVNALNGEASADAVERIRELRKGVTLDRGDMSLREMAHLGHKY